MIEKLKSAIRDIPDFPKKGIIFKDITPVLKDRELFSILISEMRKPFENSNINKVVGIESRGFILGGALSIELGAGFVPLRKPGKLPYKTYSAEYELEYGVDKIEMHIDAIEKGEKVLIVDDVIATGGTAKAAIELVEKAGGIVEGVEFFIELTFLNGREKIKDYNIVSLVKF